MLPVLVLLIGATCAQYTQEYFGGSSFYATDGAMSLDASKTIFIAENQAAITTDWNFEATVVKSVAGRLNDVAVSSDGTKACIVATDGGNVYMSSDSGDSWESVASLGTRHWKGVSMSSDGLKIVICSYPNYSNGQNNGLLFLSSDGGSTWNQLSVTGKYNGVAMSTDGQIIAAAPEDGMLQISTDGGASFTEYGQSLKWTGIAMSSDGSKMVAGQKWTGNPGYVSSDTGATWTMPTVSSGEWDGVAMAADGKIFVVGTGSSGKIWSSTDGGTTWQEDFTGTDSQQDWKGISVSSDGSIVLAYAARPWHKNWPVVTTTTTTITATMTNTSTATATTSTSLTLTSSNTVTETSTVITGTSTSVTSSIYTSTSTATGTSTETSTAIMGTSTETSTAVTGAHSRSNVVEVILTLTVEDPALIKENATLTTAMIQGFADVMGVDASQVTLEFQVSRRLQARKHRKLQVQLLAIFSVTLPSAEAAEETRAAIDSVSITDTNSAISDAVVVAGFQGNIEITGKVARVEGARSDSGDSGSKSVGVFFALAFLLVSSEIF